MSKIERFGCVLAVVLALVVIAGIIALVWHYPATLLLILLAIIIKEALTSPRQVHTSHGCISGPNIELCPHCHSHMVSSEGESFCSRCGAKPGELPADD